MPAPSRSFVIACALSSTLLLAGCQKEEAVEASAEIIRPVKLATIGHQSVSIRYFPAEFVASQETDLAFRVSGELEKLPVTEGEKVRKGQLLAALDDQDFLLNVKQRQTAYDLAMLQHQRISAMVKQKAATQAQLDEVKTSMEQAETALQQAKNQLTYSAIKAPYDGVIAKVYADNYEFVSATAPIVKLENAETIDVRFQVPEDLIARIRKDNTSYLPQVSVESVPGKFFEARYKEHSTNPDPSTKGYDVILTMPRPNPDSVTLLPGMTAEVKVNVNELLGDPAFWLVPVEAVFMDEAKPVDSEDRSVWVYNSEDHRLTKRAVTIGELQGDMIQVTSGLREGEQIVAAGVHAIKEGMEVRPWVKERGL
ncbi:efflux RND transporter periplasmic adaptor subunit [Oceanospirillum sanctuarii]|uniref:efflux RND transporter periplasmic adaptor subunit n=1 Tax=Oceanospirillum sanctuarii TaxID=1434821 RepID=UPI000A38B09F|nr:efflux RND transporter periplasmic adaptor subunit [Oceanospirillum sanctuarii]